PAGVSLPRPLHDALPISRVCAQLPYGTVDWVDGAAGAWLLALLTVAALATGPWWRHHLGRRPWWLAALGGGLLAWVWPAPTLQGDRKSTRLNSSHVSISY